MGKGGGRSWAKASFHKNCDPPTTPPPEIHIWIHICRWKYQECEKISYSSWEIGRYSVLLHSSSIPSPYVGDLARFGVAHQTPPPTSILVSHNTAVVLTLQKVIYLARDDGHTRFTPSDSFKLFSRQYILIKDSQQYNKWMGWDLDGETRCWQQCCPQTHSSTLHCFSWDFCEQLYANSFPTFLTRFLGKTKTKRSPFPFVVGKKKKDDCGAKYFLVWILTPRKRDSSSK